MTAIIEQIFAAVHTKLGEIAGGTTDRNRTSTSSAKECPLRILYDGDEDLRDNYSGRDEWTALADVEVLVTGDTDAELGPAVNAEVDSVVKKLLADPTLGGLATDVRHVAREREPLIDDSGDRMMVVVLTFEIDYATAEGDPSTPAPE